MPDPQPLDVTGLRAVLARPVGDIAFAKVLNPNLGDLIASVKPQQGVPRGSITVPICPTDALTDTVVLEDPGNPAVRFVIPRYRVATTTTDRGTQFRVLLQRQDPGTRFSVVLEPFVPPEVAAVAPDARPLVPQLACVLRYEIPGSGGMSREVALTDRRDVDAGVELSVVVPTLADRGELYAALTTAEARAALVVRRQVTVAVPAEMGLAPEPLVGERFVLRRRFPVADAVRVGPDPAARIVEPRVPVEILQPVEVVQPAPAVRADLAAAVVRDMSAVRVAGLARRRRIDDGLLDIGEPLIPDRLHPRPRPRPMPSPQPGSQPEQLYRTTTRTVEQVVAPSPFVFSPDLNPSIFGDIRAQGGQGGMVLEQIPFGDRHHSYYYQPDRPTVVYYLPDAFTLARVPGARRGPLMSVTFQSEDGVLDHASAVVLFAAAPTVSAERLAAAEQVLRTRITGAGGAVAGPLDLQPVLADRSRMTVRIALPGAAGAATELPDALVDLRAGLRAGFAVPLPAFQAMFDRIDGADPALLDGQVEVRLDRADRPAEQVPIVVRMDRLSGPVVDVSTSLQRDEPRYGVTITNAIESPVRVEDVVAALPQAAGPLPCEVQGLPPASSALAAGAAITGTVVPTTAPAEPDVRPEVVVTRAVVQPDRDAIWDSICEDTTSHLARDLTVKTPAAMFAAPAAGGSPVLELVVEISGLTGGLTQTVSLNEATLQASATIAVPIADLVLRTEDAGQYRYRVSTVRADRVVDGPWRTRSSAILWIVTEDIG